LVGSAGLAGAVVFVAAGAAAGAGAGVFVAGAAGAPQAAITSSATTIPQTAPEIFQPDNVLPPAMGWLELTGRATALSWPLLLSPSRQLLDRWLCPAEARSPYTVRKTQ
jgi:hypothetical protein